MQIDWPIVLAFSRALLTFAGAASWPAAAAVIAFQFRAPITGAIDRARKLSAFGVEADLPANPQLAGTGEDRSSAGATISATQLSVSPEPAFDPVLSPKDEWVRSLIEKEPLTVEQKYGWAIRLAALMLSNAENERAYRLIYGTQLAFIRQLNSMGSVTMEVARQFFTNRRDPSVTAPHYNFEAWLTWLTNQKLVETTGVGDAAMISVTPVARNFLSWMVVQGASDEKPL